MFNLILIIVIPSGEEHLKETLIGYTGYKKRACKIILDYKYENIADSMEEMKIP